MVRSARERRSAGARAAGRHVARFAGPRDACLPTLALVVPAVLCFALEQRRLEPFQVGAYATMELYTRLAAEGSQRVGTESRFQVHQPGPSFFYAAAPTYVLLGESTRGMAAASLSGTSLSFSRSCAGRAASLRESDRSQPLSRWARFSGHEGPS
jgi:hypothetical protein